MPFLILSWVVAAFCGGGTQKGLCRKVSHKRKTWLSILQLKCWYGVYCECSVFCGVGVGHMFVHMDGVLEFEYQVIIGSQY